MSNPGGATISTEQLKARYVGTGESALLVGDDRFGGRMAEIWDIAFLT